MHTDDQAAVETIVLAIEIDGPGRPPALFDDFSTSLGDRRLSERLDDVLAAPACPCGRRVKAPPAGLVLDAANERRTGPGGHVCEVIPFPGRGAPGPRANP